jgi:hypothetical protein
MSVLQLALRSSRLIQAKPLSFTKFLGATRTIKTSHQETEESQSGPQAEWKPIFKQQKITSFLAISKLKYYPVAFTAVGVPVSYFVPFFEPSIVGILGVTATIALSLGSFATKNIVGFVYTNKKDPALVKFAFLDFWGRRKDIEANISDVKPFSEMPLTKLDFFFTEVAFNDDPMRLKLIHKHGGVLDRNEFNRVFGEP